MAFVTGTLLIDAPASALNNMGRIPDEREDNTVGVKQIRTKEGIYPYVSAQAFRYWLRTSLPRNNTKWQNAPMYKEDTSLAYTAADPLEYWDDDLFGYMRAPKGENLSKRRVDPEYAKLTPLQVRKEGSKEKELAITRLSPFRMSTLVSIAPVQLVGQFESMSRHEGDPVPYVSQFYRTTLKGLFSLNLHACGTFSYADRTGFRNLDGVRRQKAEAAGLEHLVEEKSYRLPLEQRQARVQALFEGLAQLEGGAKQTLHYTDVAPALIVMAVTRGGNHMFGHTLGASRNGLPECKLDSLREALTVFRDDLLSPVYVGWVRGYLDDERAKFEAFANEYNADTPYPISISHPRTALLTLAQEFAKNPGWLD